MIKGFGEREAKRKNLVIDEQGGSQSMLIKGVVFGVLNNKKNT